VQRDPSVPTQGTTFKSLIFIYFSRPARVHGYLVNNKSHKWDFTKVSGIKVSFLCFFSILIIFLDLKHMETLQTYGSLSA
jgi:hypothetical protein